MVRTNFTSNLSLQDHLADYETAVRGKKDGSIDEKRRIVTGRGASKTDLS